MDNIIKQCKLRPFVIDYGWKHHFDQFRGMY